MISRPLIGFLGALLLVSAPVACGDSSSSGDPGNGNGPDGPGGPDPHSAPPVSCGSDGQDADGSDLDFANNLIASPAPPGALDAKNAPQIVVFGWDDVESAAGISFVNGLLGDIENPNKSKGSCQLNPNGCYAGSSLDPCGDGTLVNAKGDVTSHGFDFGNHTLDHLESNSAWSGIPEAWKDPDTGGWKFTSDGFGPGIGMERDVWKTILDVNDGELKKLYGVSSIQGFRAPRLEINDQGLLALGDMGYFDETLEEILPEGYTDAAINVDTDAKKGFGFFPWPYTLDNGSPGIWSQQADGDKKYVTNYPTGVWEVPVYQVYVPNKDGLGKDIADAMIAADKDCTFPPDVPKDQQTHCYLSDGELNPGDTVKEVTAFDFNTFIYSRMTHDQWLQIMKHTFLLRFYGNRAPLTYGAHPIEYTDPYDSYTLSQQGNNYGYRNVLKYNKYTDRQQAMKDFVQWITSDPVLSKETYFMSAAQLVAYMKKPFDKAGKSVDDDAVADNASNALFTRLGWTSSGAKLKATDGNTADITFDVKNVDDEPVSVGAGVTQGSLKDVTHIDIAYTTEVPFRIRLITSDGTLSRTVLLAGVGGNRLARIRIKDFFPGPEATAAQVSSASVVDAGFMAKVAGISFESAATAITGAKSFKTHIEQLTLHGAETASLCK